MIFSNRYVSIYFNILAFKLGWNDSVSRPPFRNVYIYIASWWTSIDTLVGDFLKLPFIINISNALLISWRFLTKCFRSDNYKNFLCKLSGYVAQTNTLVDLTYKLCNHCLVLVTNAIRWRPHEISSKSFTKWI